MVHLPERVRTPLRGAAEASAADAGDRYPERRLLDVWAVYFPEALCIVGCDINPDCIRLRYDDPRVTVVVGDANTDEVEQRIAAASPQFDLIIDDGSHDSENRASCCL